MKKNTSNKYKPNKYTGRSLMYKGGNSENPRAMYRKGSKVEMHVCKPN